MELNLLLKRAVELGASDIHLKVGVPPILRRDGSLGPLEEAPLVTDRDAEAVLEIVGKRAPDRPAARPCSIPGGTTDQAPGSSTLTSSPTVNSASPASSTVICSCGCRCMGNTAPGSNS